MAKTQANSDLPEDGLTMPEATYGDPLLNGEYVGVELLPPNPSCDFPPTDPDAGNHGPQHTMKGEQPNVEWGGTVKFTKTSGPINSSGGKSW